MQAIFLRGECKILDTVHTPIAIDDVNDVLCQQLETKRVEVRLDLRIKIAGIVADTDGMHCEQAWVIGASVVLNLQTCCQHDA